jgi:hypothetical protein
MHQPKETSAICDEDPRYHSCAFQTRRRNHGSQRRLT